MAEFIRHDADTHDQANSSLSGDYKQLVQLEGDLNGIAKQLTHIWHGDGADSFFDKHRTLMNDVTALCDSVKALNGLRQGAYEDFQGADHKVARMWRTR